jgi:ankyrin repeat protein
MRKLLAVRGKVDVSDGYGRTALMEACRVGHDEAVKLLLECGADPYKKSFSDKNAFQYALTLQVAETLFKTPEF